MNDFTASNGMRIDASNPTGVVILDDDGDNTLRGYEALDRNDMQALREFFQAEADERLGRCRTAVDPDFVVYEPREGQSARVLRESTAQVLYYHRSETRSTHPSAFESAARAYFDAHPEPKPQGVHMLSYDFCKTLPVGSSVVDFEGYWAGRCYVKTSDATWAYFSSRPEVGTHWRAVDERRNNLSPGPSDYWAHVYDPPERPKPWHEAAPGEVWDVDLPSGGMRAVTFYSARHDEPITVFRDAHTQIEIETDDPDIRDARCLFSEARGIWPEVS